MLLSNTTWPFALPLQSLIELVMQGVVELIDTPIVLSCISELWLVDNTGERTALDVAGGDPALKL